MNHSHHNVHLIRTVYLFFLLCIVSASFASNSDKIRKTENFNKEWKFQLGDVLNGQENNLDDKKWRVLNLPHDWSIEGKFDKDNPATTGGGALPGGIGWYRKTFIIPESDRNKLIYIEFDGIYRNSEVWINNNYLGKRPYGYSSFRYELSPYLKYGNEKNVIAVKVDNSKQPNSRWYSGSGIYRNVRLVTTNKIAVDHWGTFITTPIINNELAAVNIQIKIKNSSGRAQTVKLVTEILDANGRSVSKLSTEALLTNSLNQELMQNLEIKDPNLWSIDNPYLYKVVIKTQCDNLLCDDYVTTFGIRFFNFDTESGFSLNGNKLKINGVCNHHDLGCLGAAINYRAIQRQLEILKEMGVNSIRTSHNPPAPELLDLCDQMGFIVMDEAFDIWRINKSEFDYALDWDEWHVRDLQDLVLRDRNHPSVIIWSIGNEVMEQWDTNYTNSVSIAKELAALVKNLDPTRPITAACNGVDPLNPIIRSGALDLIGYNYSLNKFKDFPDTYPGKIFIATETVSALATRGHYDFPADSIRRWPIRWDLPFENGNPDHTCSSYDNCSTPWGSTQEETWKEIKKYDFLSGQYIWTGFDYLGEPTPYPWPSRSSYFGIVDLAGFPKDSYFLYQSEWTNKDVLHIFPHWNWNDGDTIDVWAYTNCNEVELFLNDKSLGIKRKIGDDLHLAWRVPYEEGTLKALGRKDDKEILTKQINTAGVPAKIILEPDREIINADDTDLSFVAVKILDVNNNLVPYANNLINFEITGEGKIVGVDNGYQANLQSFKEKFVNAYNGKCLVVIQSTETQGEIKLIAKSDKLPESSIIIKTKSTQ